eukprot:EG_transcript_8942
MSARNQHPGPDRDWLPPPPQGPDVAAAEALLRRQLAQEEVVRQAHAANDAQTALALQQEESGLLAQRLAAEEATARLLEALRQEEQDRAVAVEVARLQAAEQRDSDAEAARALYRQEQEAHHARKRAEEEATARLLQALRQQEEARVAEQMAADAEIALALRQEEQVIHLSRRLAEEEATAWLVQALRLEEQDRALAAQLEQEQAAVVAAQLAADTEAAEAQQAALRAQQALCRFCDALMVAPRQAPPELHCQREECQEKGRHFCSQRLPCGHPCGGLFGEEKCPPCTRCNLHDDACPVCLDGFPEGPVLQLDCGHVFHHACVAGMVAEVAARGRHVDFNRLQCPLRCPGLIRHPALPEADPLHDLHLQLTAEALHRAQQDAAHPADNSPPAEDLLRQYPFYTCFVCGDTFCTGAGCVVGEPDPAAVLCSSCQARRQAGCLVHGNDHLGWKCYFCCQSATFECGAAARRFCDSCHALGYDAPARPCDPATCPLGGAHPANPCDFAMGCALCRGR